MGLVAAGEEDSEAVRRGVEYLIDRQQESGDWQDAHWTGTGFPDVFYLKYHLYQVYFPLFALSYYRNVKGSATSRVADPETSRRLAFPSGVTADNPLGVRATTRAVSATS